MTYFNQYSNFVKDVDFAFLFILGIAFFFLIGLTATVIIFIFKYNKKKHPVAVQLKENSILEITWTVIPLILVLLMFYYGYIGYMPMRNAPANSFVVKAEGHMWEYEFTYPNGKTSHDLYIPINKPIKLILTSRDVIHGFFIPAFRVKEDMVPGKENHMWFVANQLGDYDIFCTVYCGLRHSSMEAKTIVLNEKDFNKWLADFTKPKVDTSEGLAILKKNSCLGCHSLDGKKIVGPTFKGLFGKDRKVLIDGALSTVKADEAYIKESVFAPNAKVVDGFPSNVMQPYKGVLTDKDVDLIIEYLKKIKD